MTAFGPDDLAQLSGILAHAADEEVMPRFGLLTRPQARQKTSAFDIVTDADEACERAIVSALQSWFPGAPVIGEEAASRDPAQLDMLASADLCFVVDPLDGTMNFASGLPLFGVMAAVVARGEVVAGVIVDPVTRTSAQAARGAGAWMVDAAGDRVRLRVAEPVPEGDVHAVAGTNFLPQPLRDQVNTRLSRLRMTQWFRCAAHEYRLAAGGHCHVLFYNRLMPWDHAAGWLLHQEAGGHAAHFDGSPYRPAHQSGGLLCAPDPGSWQAVRDALLGEQA